MAYVIGLTGGIGSGKSAAADQFALLGAAVVDTDAIAHELTGPGGAAIPEVRRQFGAGCIAADGAMDRTKVRELVFADPTARKKLEALLHPMIRAESQRRIAAAGRRPMSCTWCPCWWSRRTIAPGCSACWWSTAPKTYRSSA